MTFRFRKTERLKGRGFIRTAFTRGRKYSCPGLKLFVVQNGLLLDRVLFTFNKKYGNSVQRNRSRRISREAYRMIKHRLMIGFDFVVLVYPGADNLETRMGQLEGVFSKAGLFTEVK